MKSLILTYPCIYENTYIPLVNQLTLKLSKMKKLTNLELSELAIMVGRMLRQIEEFIHVSNLMDQKLKLELEKYYEQLCSEMDKREI